jgi:hypothetical protein
MTKPQYTLSIVAVVLLAACSSFVPDGVSAPARQLEGLGPSCHSHGKEYLYLGSELGSASQFIVYPVNGSKPIRELGRSWGVYAMAIDRWGDIYTADGLPSGGEITAYTAAGCAVLLTIDIDFATGLAFDVSGNLYVAAGGGVVEYKARSRKRLRAIGDGINNPYSVAVDSFGNLYVALLEGSGSGDGVIEIYAPGESQPFRSITTGIHTPVAMLFDQSGDLYVANCPACFAAKGDGSVTEYPPGSGTPMRVLKRQINTPDALASGQNATLFVASNPSLKSGVMKPGWVSVYGPTGTAPIRKITKKVKGVRSLAVSADGDLYVESAWSHKSDILVFTPDGARLVRTITDGVSGPNLIAVGRESVIRLP